jgi:membrane fusion protein, multidrug efflux system
VAQDDGSDGERQGGRRDGDEGREGEHAQDGESRQADAQRDSPEKRRKRRRTLIIAVLVLVVLAVLVWIWYEIFRAGRVSTDDAYTDGQAVTVAPQVGGYVVLLAVTDNQPVRAGDVLLRIDPRTYRAALDAASAQLETATAQLRGAELNLSIARVAQPANLSSAIAARDAAQAALQRAQADYQRQQRVNPAATTRTLVDQAREAEASSVNQLREAEARLRTARLVTPNIQLAESQVRELQAQVDSARAQWQRSQLDLGYTVVRAPQDGRVTMRTVQQGDFVQPGQALLALVTPDEWITANFKETDLANMRPGQPVTIRIDAFPSLRLHGHVDSFQMGTGSRFSAFPTENATGNFVKIVQRLPVKILIDGGLAPDHMLPLGLSVDPTVDERVR